MAPSHSRQLLVWTLPTVAAILSYLWYYKRKRLGSKSDPGDDTSERNDDSRLAEGTVEVEETLTPSSSQRQSSKRSFSRSLSGVDSAPIDIVIPPKLKASKSNPVVISDEDLDKQIEKIKSMKYRSSVIDINNRTPVVENESIPIEVKIDSFTPIVKAHPRKSVAKSPVMAQNPTPEKSSMESPKKEVKTPTPPTGGSLVNEELTHRRNSERDSANHSPADVMLASPSLSSISDNHSEGSNDSGKGGSDVVTPPPSRTPGPAAGGSMIYEFLVPQTLVGKLIGKHGCFVLLIKDKTGAHIVVRKHPTNNKMKICAIEGNQKEIDSALKLIRDKFPPKKFPDVTLEQVSILTEVPTVPLVSDHLYLKLVEGINNDAIVSCMVSPNHLFLQQPTHPTFPNLNILNNFMNLCYTEADSPLLPSPIPENTVCAAFSVDSWFRSMVLSTDVEKDTSYVKFLDYGGYAYVDNSKLRQIRGDFMLLPFQAAECFLANVKPIANDVWPEEAYTMVAELTKGAIIYTQVADYSPEGVPLVYCYVVLGPQQFVFLNQELVDQGHAEWIEYQPEENAVALVVEEASGLTVQ